MRKKDKERYITYAHAKTRLRYHLIFSTKYRRKCLRGVHDELVEAFRFAERHSHFKLHEINEDEDHVHLLVEMRPTYSIANVVARMKQLTTRFLWERKEEHLRKFYWGSKRLLWTHGYFCSTIGEVSEETIKHYIQNQG